MTVEQQAKQMLTRAGLSPERALLAACSFWSGEDFSVYLPCFVEPFTADTDKISNEHKAVMMHVLSLRKARNM